MKNEVRDSNYYVELAQLCMRWSRLQRDRKIIIELEKMADECMKAADRLYLLDHAKYKAA